MNRRWVRWCMLASLLAVFGVLPPSAARASSIILDGTFQNTIGPGGYSNNPWADWTNVGITRHDASGLGIPGNYASLPYGADLFQQVSIPGPGEYLLSFLVQNQSPWEAQLVFSFQSKGGYPSGWLDYINVLDLSASTGFVRETFVVNLTHSGTDSTEFYFSNSYNAPDPTYGLENSRNPQGTIINVADVSLTPTAVPEPSTLVLLGTGAAVMRLVRRRKK